MKSPSIFPTTGGRITQNGAKSKKLDGGDENSLEKNHQNREMKKTMNNTLSKQEKIQKIHHNS